MNITVAYYSLTGNTKAVAEYICEGVREAAGADAQAFSLTDLDKDYVASSRCFILGSPAYLGTMAAPVKHWLDMEAGKYPLGGKLVGAFATADYIHGGGDIAVQSILCHLIIRGTLAYSGGEDGGKPVIHFGPVAITPDLASFAPLFRLYGQRMAKKAMSLFG